jgi:hypothetical protein
MAILITASSTILVVGHASDVFAPAPPIPLTQTYKFQISNLTYYIKYNATAGMEVKAMYGDSSTNTIFIVLNSTSENGQFTIELPRQIIDSKNSIPASGCYITSTNNTNVYVPCGEDRPYDVIVSNYPDKSNPKHVDPIYKTFTPEARTLTIDHYQKGTSVTAIAGTYIVPEFSSVAVVIMAVAVAAMLGFSIFARKNILPK